MALCGLFHSLPVQAGTLYVWQDSPNPVVPYADWATAAHTIQDAVDAALASATVLVTNGLYAGGGRYQGGFLKTRVVLDKPLTLLSVNGPAVTVIAGAAPPGGGLGNGAIRCAYVGTNAVLSGFTLTNGHTLEVPITNKAQVAGGGAWCEVSGVVSNCTLSGNFALWGGGAAYGTLNNCTLSGNSASDYCGGAFGCKLNNCVLTGNSARSDGGGVYYGTLNICTLSGNSADSGGGSYDSTLNYCTLTGNSARSGGGATDGTLSNCTLTGNSAQAYGGGACNARLNNCTLSGNSVASGSGAFGGGAYNSVLNNCTLTGNSAFYGGGVSSGTLNHCGLSGNSAYVYGGGSLYGELNNCTLTDNSSTFGGGAYSGTLKNCTMTGNSATNSGGGAYYSELTNCIVYYNRASSGPNYSGSNIAYSCTSPLPPGPGNITTEPAFIDLAGANLRLQTNSPCINAGNNASAPGTTDLDGRPRIVGGVVDMGAYEYQGPGMGEFIGWLQQFALPTDGSADFSDPDGDQLNNWQEWVAGTNPTDTLSVLRLLPLQQLDSHVLVRWSSVSNRSYYLESSTNLETSPCFLLLATNLSAQSATTTYIDTNAVAGPRFYRVGVSWP